MSIFAQIFSKLSAADLYFVGKSFKSSATYVFKDVYNMERVNVCSLYLNGNLLVKLVLQRFVMKMS